MQAVIDKIYQQVAPLLSEAKVAHYIPALAEEDAQQLGIAIETIEGKRFQAGNVSQAFSVQSISKVFNLTRCLQLVGEELWQRVGVEPSGDPFNSLVQLEYERGIPRNPFINAGALVVVDVLMDHLKNPAQELKSFVESLCGETIGYDSNVFDSELETAHINRALVNFMKGHDNIRNPVEAVIRAYLYQCAMTMNCAELARAALFMANSGVVPSSGERILTASQCKRLNAVLLTCGVYDEAGEFAYRVGIPAKSGVGGGIVAIIPGKLAIAVWSPALNPKGNSQLGMKVLELFTTETGLSIF